MRNQYDVKIIQKNGKNYVKNWWNIDYYKPAYESLAKKYSRKSGWWYDITKEELDKEMANILETKQYIINAIEADKQMAKSNNYHYSNENLYNPRRQYIKQKYNNQQYLNDYSDEEKRQYGYWLNPPKKYDDIFQNQGQNIIYNNVGNRINQYYQNNNNLQNQQYSYKNYNNIGYYNKDVHVVLDDWRKREEKECLKYNEQIMQYKYNQQKIQKQNIQNLNDRKEQNNINDNINDRSAQQNKQNLQNKQYLDQDLNDIDYCRQKNGRGEKKIENEIERNFEQRQNYIQANECRYPEIQNGKNNDILNINVRDDVDNSIKENNSFQDTATVNICDKNKSNNNHKNQQENEVSAYPYKNKIDEINSNTKFYQPSYKKTHIKQEDIDNNFLKYRQDIYNNKEPNNKYAKKGCVDYISNICK